MIFRLLKVYKQQGFTSFQKQMQEDIFSKMLCDEYINVTGECFLFFTIHN